MRSWVLGIALLAVLTASLASAQDDCPSGRPSRLIPNVIPVLGQSPMWVATGGGPVAWEGPNQPVRLLWIRDVAARGPAFLSGKVRAGTAKARFATTLYGVPDDRLKFDLLGAKPPGIKEADLQRYAFYWAFVYFPVAGCYEMTARVGQQQSVIYLKVPAGTAKARNE